MFLLSVLTGTSYAIQKNHLRYSGLCHSSWRGMGSTFVLTDFPCICVEDVSKRLYIKDVASSICVRLLCIPSILLPCLGT